MASALRASLAPAGLSAAALSGSPLGGRKEHLGASLRASAAGTHGRVTMALRARRDPRLIAPVDDKFLPWLADAARSDEGRAQISDAASGRFDGPPLLDLAAAKMAATQMAAPAQVERGGGYGEHRPRRPPPDLPSLLLNSRIVYVGMPVGGGTWEKKVSREQQFRVAPAEQPNRAHRHAGGCSNVQVRKRRAVAGGYGAGSNGAGGSAAAVPAVVYAICFSPFLPPRPPPSHPAFRAAFTTPPSCVQLVPAVTELVIAQLLYLQWLDPRQPTYVYLNSTGTSRADGETVGMETEGFAIYDTMMQMKNEMQTVGVGAAIGQACMLLAAGEKGRRFMLPHATAMIQQPRLPSTGQMSAIDVHIRAKEVVNNRDTLVKLLARHTGNSFEKIAKTMERPYYMNPQRALEFGVIDKILWRGQEAMAKTLSAEEWDKGAGIRMMEKPAAPPA
ncbi:unnamed protein product [Closterium sp. NIES-65]|nr:unnamed protein product [Closterium sp. NIES-65]